MAKHRSEINTAVVLDDDADTRFAIKRILSKCGCEVFEAESVEEAIAITETHDVNVIFSDIRIPGEPGGEELLDVVQEEEIDVHVILMSCAMDEEMQSRLLSKGADECVQKPFYAETAQQILDRLIVPIQKSA